ncbi:hypothetical protein PMAYCL1PPCAC_33238, partial [Pristionchus mayeri]
NQIFTWVSVSWREAENSALSAIERYCFCWNFFSNVINCCVENGVRGLRLFLCFRSMHLLNPSAIFASSEAVKDDEDEEVDSGEEPEIGGGNSEATACCVWMALRWCCEAAICCRKRYCSSETEGKGEGKAAGRTAVGLWIGESSSLSTSLDFFSLSRSEMEKACRF